jgi:hypothetical protein
MGGSVIKKNLPLQGEIVLQGNGKKTEIIFDFYQEYFNWLN